MKTEILIRLGSICLSLLHCLCSVPQQNKAPEVGQTLRIPVYSEDPTIDKDLFSNYSPAEAGNAPEFCANRIIRREDSPLAGKTIYWLGSSVTEGSASLSEAVPEMLAQLTGCTCAKEALPGTTFFTDETDEGQMSYVKRLQLTKKLDKTAKIDAFICQISTNDAMRPDLFGEILQGDGTDFDLSTTLGGVEFIISYVNETWHCPIFFYSGSWFNSDNYAREVEAVKKIAEKWNARGVKVGVIDLFNDQAFNALVDEDLHAIMMSDSIHPKKAGYALWWTPYFEQYLLEHLV